jgi:hypothetical protein
VGAPNRQAGLPNIGNFKVISRGTTSRWTGTLQIITEATYTTGKPPRIKRKVWVEQDITVYWTPELNTDLNKGPVAGMEFLNRLAEYRAGKRHTAAETREMLDLAERAISVKYQQP